MSAVPTGEGMSRTQLHGSPPPPVPATSQGASPTGRRSTRVCVVSGPPSVPGDLNPAVLTIGVFDGVHRGHRELLAQAAALGAPEGLPLRVVTFDRHPVRLLRPSACPPQLTTLRRRVELLVAAGADEVIVLRFDRTMAAWDATAFAEEMLFGALRGRVVAVGTDFRFGHRAAGDTGLLARLAAARGLIARPVDLLADDALRISSTRIRRAIAAGDVTTAATLLGRPHELEGTVVEGDRRGRELGVPTANLAVPTRLLVPAHGVYAGRLRPVGPAGAARGVLPPAGAPAVASIGTNPTFAGHELRVEAHVLDLDPSADLYGQRLALTLEHRLRGERRFDSVDELVVWMRRDVARSRELLGQA